MYCMKCGRETKENQIFCQDCLADMATRPVKPGTPVLLPNRPPAPVSRKSANRRKEPTAAEQIEKLRRMVQRLALCMIALIAVLFFTISILLHTIETQNTQGAIGQNYSTMTQTDGN